MASATFAERPICPYCDGPLVRRNDDDVEVLQKRLQEFNAKTQPLADFYGKCRFYIASMATEIARAVFNDISRLIEERVLA